MKRILFTVALLTILCLFNNCSKKFVKEEVAQTKKVAILSFQTSGESPIISKDERNVHQIFMKAAYPIMVEEFNKENVFSVLSYEEVKNNPGIKDIGESEGWRGGFLSPRDTMLEGLRNMKETDKDQFQKACEVLSVDGILEVEYKILDPEHTAAANLKRISEKEPAATPPAESNTGDLLMQLLTASPKMGELNVDTDIRLFNKAGKLIWEEQWNGAKLKEDYHGVMKNIIKNYRERMAEK